MMKKRITAALLCVVLCFAMLGTAYAATPNVSVSGKAGQNYVTVTASGLTANKTYAMCSIVQGDTLMALFNMTTDASGNYTGTVITGPLTQNQTLKVAIPDQTDGTGDDVASGSSTVAPSDSGGDPDDGDDDNGGGGGNGGGGNGGGGSGGGGGGGGGSSSSSSNHTVSVPSTSGGKVSVSPSNASEGSTVTITVTPNAGYALDRLVVTDAKGQRLTLTDAGSGKYTFTMPATAVNIDASFLPEEDVQSAGFSDVPRSAYYYDAVQWAVAQGVTQGTSASTFSPEAFCTRAQTVTFLWRAAGSPEPATTANPFTDVSASAYYYKAVLWAVEKGITFGTSPTTFSPDATVTRGQVVTFQYRAAGSPATSATNPFTDVHANDYFADAVIWAAGEGITSGTTATTFSPHANCTRAQIVTFLYRDMAQ